MRQHTYHDHGVLKPTALVPRILIVDDDVDAAVLVASVFQNLGCETVCTLTSHEARKHIFQDHADIIVLDWCLDHHRDASVMMRDCVTSIERYGGVATWVRPRVVTYSGLDEREIQLLDPRYFHHVGHWHKPVQRREMIAKALDLLRDAGL